MPTSSIQRAETPRHNAQSTIKRVITVTPTPTTIQTRDFANPALSPPSRQFNGFFFRFAFPFVTMKPSGFSICRLTGGQEVRPDMRPVSARPHFALFVLSCVLIPLSAARASVTFIFDYSDPSNTTDFGSGAFFDASPFGTARKMALADTAADIGSTLGHTATVKVHVKTIFSPTGPLASGGAAYYVPPTASGVVMAATQSSIIMGTPLPPTAFHATLTWNAAKPFYTGLSPVVSPSGFFDFRSVAWHELTHALGWQSALKPGPGGYTSGLTDALQAVDPVLYAGLGELFTTYDTLLADSAGHGAILGGSVNPLFSHISGVDVAGPNVLLLGDPVPTDTTPFPPHYDTTHLASIVDSIMGPTLAAGEVKRGWTDIDEAIMKDLGYEIVPEPALGLPLLLVAMLYRRRK